MELKKYQQDVIEDLTNYLQEYVRTKKPDEAYRLHWNRKGVIVGAGKLPDYQNVVKEVPHVCLKVPTAGGKTFIACNSLHHIFESSPLSTNNLVIWLVPSKAILTQTLKNLRDVEHPYRKRLNAHFAGKIEIFSKEEALQGAGFNPDSFEAQLNILVLSFDSFRATNKEGRKVYQENANLAPFPQTFGKGPEEVEADETSLVRVLAAMRPVIVVDESHNAQTKLSVEMLKNLNPRFILELTATPRDSSNVISTVHPVELKTEEMVKLPVIVYNDQNATQVLHNAISLRSHLEAIAEQERESGGRYIRPVVLIQAEPKNSRDSVTFEKLKSKLIDAGIPEEEIAIKTADKDEIGTTDLLSEESSIRYIITVNALKEGWDCSFAYILATVTNRSSKIEVEQILGRILRQPFAKLQSNSLLNLSYVFTCSSQFHSTLDEIVKGLNKAGFSGEDYRVAGEYQISEGVEPVQAELDDADPVESLNSAELHITEAKSTSGASSDNLPESVQAVIQNAKKKEYEYRETHGAVADRPFSLSGGTAPEEALMNGYKIRTQFTEQAKTIELPQFFIQLPHSFIFGEEDSSTKLKNIHLLNDFRLSGKDTDIDFSSAPSRAYAVDITNDDYTGPEYQKIKPDDPFYREFIDFLKKQPEDELKREIAGKIRSQYRRVNHLDDGDLATYVARVLENLSADQIEELKERPGEYISKIVSKIQILMRQAAEESFRKKLAAGEVFLKPYWKFEERIAPNQTHQGIPKALYEKEGEINSFEHRVINEVANLENIQFWHRNLERREFAINAFINHYPDFIILTNSGKVVVIETKGDDRDNSDSIMKLRLGSTWADKAGDKFSYFMVFDNNPLEGAWSFSDFIDVVRRM